MGKYQRGSVRRLKGRNGDSWEWRYRIKGVMKQETYPLSEYPNEASLLEAPRTGDFTAQ
jgi:hypothetical protein